LRDVFAFVMNDVSVQQLAFLRTQTDHPG
jgi:hypothetical protein